MYQIEANDFQGLEPRIRSKFNIEVNSEDLFKYLSALAVLSLVLIVVILPGRLVSFSSLWVRLIAMVSISAVFGSALWGLFRLYMEARNGENTIHAEEEVENKKYERSQIAPEEVLLIQNKLRSAMEHDQIYLKADLKLEDLAAHTNFAKHIVTQVLNEFMHVNFYQFVNNYRLEEFKLRIRHDRNMDYTILAHAFDSGFQSKSSFNKVFKEHVHMTPSEYRRGLNLKRAS